MRFHVSQSDILTGVQTVQRAVSTQTIVPVLSGILLDAEEEHVRLSGTDTQIRIEWKTPARVEEPGKVVLPVKYLAEMLRRTPDTEVSIAVGEASLAEITWGGAHYVVHGLPAEGFPELKTPQNLTQIETTQGVIRSLIRRTVFASARDESRILLTGVLFKASRGKIDMVATDGVRLSKVSARFGGDLGDVEAIIPSRALGEMARLCSGHEDEPGILSIGPKNVLLEVGGARLASSLIEGQYPEYERVMPRDFASVLTVERNALHDALDRAGLVSQSSNAVRLRARDGRINISAHAPAVGQGVEEIEGLIQGSDMEISFNARYVTEGLKAFDSGDILVQVPGPDKATVIKAPGDDDFVYLVLPLKIG
ncbi:MAG: DNA polymerase III subunit beta [Bacillota bacterium]